MAPIYSSSTYLQTGNYKPQSIVNLLTLERNFFNMCKFLACFYRSWSCIGRCLRLVTMNFDFWNHEQYISYKQKAVNCSSTFAVVFPILPVLFRLLGMSVVPKTTEKFYDSVVTEAMKNRKDKETVSLIGNYLNMGLVISWWKHCVRLRV